MKVILWDQEIDNVESMSQNEINKKVAKAKEKYLESIQEANYYDQ